MPTNGMTIDGLNTVSALTAQDKVPVWDNESSGEPTRKITAQNLANSVKSLASLPNTTEMNDAIAQSTAAISKVNSNANMTCDIISDALACTATTFFRGAGSDYTGTLPNDYYRYGIFMVNVRYERRYIIAHAEDDSFAVNVYNGSSWTGWHELIALTNITLSSNTRVSFPFTAPHAGILRVLLRAQAQGRVYVIFDSGEMVDGYQEAGAYVVNDIPIQKGKTLTITNQFNVMDMTCDWYEFNF